MIYSIKDGKYSGDNTLSTAWGAAFIAGAAERGLPALQLWWHYISWTIHDHR